MHELIVYNLICYDLTVQSAPWIVSLVLIFICDTVFNTYWVFMISFSVLFQIVPFFFSLMTRLSLSRSSRTSMLKPLIMFRAYLLVTFPVSNYYTDFHCECTTKPYQYSVVLYFGSPCLHISSNVMLYLWWYHVDAGYY